jgi:hypothetical protein
MKEKRKGVIINIGAREEDRILTINDMCSLQHILIICKPPNYLQPKARIPRFPRSKTPHQ